jgi:hypothetical protein
MSAMRKIPKNLQAHGLATKVLRFALPTVIPYGTFDLGDDENPEQFMSIGRFCPFTNPRLFSDTCGAFLSLPGYSQLSHHI